MLNELKQEANYTRTENGALTYATTYSDCLDLFSSIGALRHASVEDIINRFNKAYIENADLAMKCLFFARDIRGGLGERRVFRTIFAWLSINHPKSVRRNIELVSEYGRYDDLLCLLDNGNICVMYVLEFIKEKLELDKKSLATKDFSSISLLGKWLPSINASNGDTIRKAKIIANYLGLSKKEYRKLLTDLRQAIKIIENNLRLKDYTFDYSKQPSKAMLKYRKAFIRNDNDRYTEYLKNVAEGKTKLHTGTLAPYDIIAPIIDKKIDLLYGNKWGQKNVFNDEERKALNTTWNALEDFTNDENALVVVDGSGSMYGSNKPCPAAVAQSLAIYFAERNKGEFHNHFITFSERPKLVEIKGKDIVDKVKYCMGFFEVANTNLAKVFQLILETAVKNKLPQKDLPSTLYIISDMEFDSCAEDADITNFEYAKRLFEEYGYKLPNVVFWNVDARNSQVPVTINEQGVALVSGNSPQVFSMIKSGTDSLNPYKFMINTLVNSGRYSDVKA